MMVQYVANFLKEFSKEEGLLILLVKQNVHIALQFVKKAYVLETGRLVLLDKFREFKHDNKWMKPILVANVAC